MSETYMARPQDVERQWWIIDAKNRVLGRVASEVAKLLRGKHKPTFTPHVDTGDYVIVVNCDKVILTGKKEEKKVYRHSRYPGGLKETTFGELLEEHPALVMENAVRGMLPKNKLGRKIFKKLRTYSGPDHPHEAQKPQEWTTAGK